MSNNIIDKIQLSGITYDIGGGGGKAIEAGRGIAITTGETADTVSFNLPISAGTGTDSVKENYVNNVASGSYSHAEGNGTSAKGNYAHAEGHQTSASGSSSHAEGELTNANGSYSHAEGTSTKANNAAAHAEEGAQQLVENMLMLKVYSQWQVVKAHMLKEIALEQMVCILMLRVIIL